MSDKKTRSIQRVVDVAVTAFCSRRLEEMSINDIARQARCSTATIYEVFGSKKELFRIAATASIRRTEYPRLDDRTMSDGLTGLFDYCMDRIAHLANDGRAQTERLLSSHFELSGAALKAFVEHELHYMREVIAREIRGCANDDLVLPFDVETIVHIIVSGTGFEPMVTGNYALTDEPDHARIMRLTFAPLLTAQGLAALERYLDANPVSATAKGFPGKPRLH